MQGASRSLSTRESLGKPSTPAVSHHSPQCGEEGKQDSWVPKERLPEPACGQAEKMAFQKASLEGSAGDAQKQILNTGLQKARSGDSQGLGHRAPQGGRGLWKVGYIRSTPASCCSLVHI